ncbi:MAG TPA: GAF domain-containing protein [Thermoanaerobaculia bacterium]|nr:GAF domain-containing protein [Thermoanaerobaculia bacterium]
MLLAGFAEAEVEAQRRRAGSAFSFEAVATEAEVLSRFERGEVAVLCLGPKIAGLRARHLLEQIGQRFPDARPLHLLTAGGPDPSLFQELIDEDRIFFLSLAPLGGDDLAALLESAIAKARARRAAAERDKSSDQAPRAALSRRVLEAAGRLAGTRDAAVISELVRADLAEFLSAARAHLLLYDPETEVLWEKRSGLAVEERRESAAVGLVSFVARTGRAVAVSPLADDPRFEREADDPEGDGRGPFCAAPVRGEEGATIAVLSAAREAGADPFSAEDRAALDLYAERAAPALAQITLESRLAEKAKLEERELRDRALDVFREEALDHHLAAARKEGEVLRISPAWVDWASWLLFGLAGASLLFLALGRIHERATGVAVVRLAGRTEITADVNGTVAAVEVSPGQRVAAGAPLVRFHGLSENADLSRLTQEFEQELAARLRDPSDRAAEAALIALRGEIELAQARVAEREVRAPRAGIVSDVRVRSGQSVVPGQVILALSTGSGPPRIAILLPGRIRPQLVPGLPLRVELDGFRYSYLRLKIESVGDEVLGPDEAKRLLGPDLAGGAPITGPIVFAWARLPGPRFVVDGQSYAFYDGLWGNAEVSLRSEPLATALMPGLRALTGGRRDG